MRYGTPTRSTRSDTGRHRPDDAPTRWTGGAQGDTSPTPRRAAPGQHRPPAEAVPLLARTPLGRPLLGRAADRPSLPAARRPSLPAAPPPVRAPRTTTASGQRARTELLPGHRGPRRIHPDGVLPSETTRRSETRRRSEATRRSEPTRRSQAKRSRRAAPAPTLRRARPHFRRPALQAPRAAQFMTKGLAALIVLSVTGLICFFIVADARRGRSAAASTTGGTALGAGELDSRAADPAPLTLQEVFPDAETVRLSTGTAAYRLTMTHIDTQCRIATVGTLGRLLEERGCTQVVRASMTAPYGDYQVTAGLFNLVDAAGAAALDDQLRRLVETGDGGFAAMAAGEPGTEPVETSASQVGWRARGHYLLYCVITRPGGGVTPGGDPNAARITADLVDDYLTLAVLGRRAGTSNA